VNLSHLLTLYSRGGTTTGVQDRTLPLQLEEATDESVCLNQCNDEPGKLMAARGAMVLEDGCGGGVPIGRFRNCGKMERDTYTLLPMFADVAEKNLMGNWLVDDDRNGEEEVVLGRR
jgi:hypothetical protein